VRACNNKHKQKVELPLRLKRLFKRRPEYRRKLEELREMGIIDDVILERDDPYESPELSKILQSFYEEGLLQYRENVNKLKYAFDKLGLVYWLWGPDNEDWCIGYEARTEKCDVYLHLLPDKRIPDVHVQLGKEEYACGILQKLRRILMQYKKEN